MNTSFSYALRPSLQSLVPDGQLAPWKVNEAIQVWNSTRSEVSRTGNYEAGERLIFLTMVLANHFSDSNDLLRQRAMFESALDVCVLPRYQQIMRGYLTRCAARPGDLAAAEQWLLPCDRQSDDLETDSAYRFSRAFIDTARGNYNGVLHVLGSGTSVVQLDGRAPYQATSKILVSNPAQLVQGGRVALRVDPQNASDVLIETD